MTWKFLNALLFLVFCINSSTSKAFAENFKLNENKSKITYSLTQFGIPFKRNCLSAPDDLGLEITSSKETNNESILFLTELDLNSKFVSKNRLF